MEYLTKQDALEIVREIAKEGGIPARNFSIKWIEIAAANGRYSDQSNEYVTSSGYYGKFLGKIPDSHQIMAGTSITEPFDTKTSEYSIKTSGGSRTDQKLDDVIAPSVFYVGWVQVQNQDAQGRIIFFRPNGTGDVRVQIQITDKAVQKYFFAGSGAATSTSADDKSDLRFYGYKLVAME